MLDRWGEMAVGVGDDAAVLDVPAGHRLVVSSDASVERVHFRREWLTDDEIAFRAGAAALSDLAAMAATPLGMLVAISLPDPSAEVIDALAAGLGEVARLTDTPIVGGDLSRGGELSLVVTVLGSAIRPVERRGIRPGDYVYVTGVLGGPCAALRAFGEGRRPDPPHAARFARPRPRLLEGRWLAQHGAAALIDISDGLASELRHLAVAGAVEIRVDLERVPVMRGCTLEEALRGGEEYELVATAPHQLDADAFAREFALPLSEIGRVRVAEHPGVTARRGEGATRVDLGGGHDHFSA